MPFRRRLVLRSQQSPEGSWNEQAGVGFTPDPGRVTALAILAYLGAGYDHMTPNMYRLTVKSGLDWLVAQQGQDGRLGVSVADHATAAMALAEAYGMTCDPALRGPAQRAKDCLRRWQVRSPHAGAGAWPAQVVNDHSDTEVLVDVSTTRWATMAIKSGKAAGLDVGDSLPQIEFWLARTLVSLSAEQLAEHGVPSRFLASPDVQVPHSDAAEATAAMAVIVVFVGRTPGDPQLGALVERLRVTRLAALHAGDPLLLGDDYATGLALAFQQTHWQAWAGACRERVFPVARDLTSAASVAPDFLTMAPAVGCSRTTCWRPCLLRSSIGRHSGADRTP